MLKNDWNFEIFAEVAHNFGKTDDHFLSKKMLISNISILGFMPNLNKKS
jgi:hypothetical protein